MEEKSIMKTNDNLEQISLKEAQYICKQMLYDFHDYCVKNGLTYYLFYGTLIGAVREKDIIPWDHDIDVVMFREEYDRFLLNSSSFEKETGYQIVNYLTRKHVPVCFTRIANPLYKYQFNYTKDNKTDDHLYFDIFVLDKGPQKTEAFKKYYRKFSFYRGILANKYNYYQSSFIRKVIKPILRFCLVPFSAKFLCTRLIKKAIKYNNSDSDNCFMIDTYFRKRQVAKFGMKVSYFGKPILLPFGEKKMFVPSNYGAILKTIYNNYMTPPSLKERICPAKFYKNNIIEKK